jgi:hypothetical protein
MYHFLNRAKTTPLLWLRSQASHSHISRSAKGVGLRLVHWEGTDLEVNITGRWEPVGPGGSMVKSPKHGAFDGKISDKWWIFFWNLPWKFT